MFEQLTSYIDKIASEETSGEWYGSFDQEQPSFPHVIYSITMHRFVDEVLKFVDAHPEMELTRYYDILEKNGLAWDSNMMEKADVANASGQLVMALIVCAIRAERFCDGTLLGFLENGCIVKWLERLKQIDDNSSIKDLK